MWQEFIETLLWVSCSELWWQNEWGVCSIAGDHPQGRACWRESGRSKLIWWRSLDLRTEHLKEQEGCQTGSGLPSKGRGKSQAWEKGKAVPWGLIGHVQSLKLRPNITSCFKQKSNFVRFLFQRNTLRIIASAKILRGVGQEFSPHLVYLFICLGTGSPVS